MDLDWIRGAGTLIGGLGQVYSAVENARAMKKINDFNKTLINRQVQKENKAQDIWDNASLKYFKEEEKKKREKEVKMDLGE